VTRRNSCFFSDVQIVKSLEQILCLLDKKISSHLESVHRFVFIYGLAVAPIHVIMNIGIRFGAI